jgi:hypothetical protein
MEEAMKISNMQLIVQASSIQYSYVAELKSSSCLHGQWFYFYFKFDPKGICDSKKIWDLII